MGDRDPEYQGEGEEFLSHLSTMRGSLISLHLITLCTLVLSLGTAQNALAQGSATFPATPVGGTGVVLPVVVTMQATGTVDRVEVLSRGSLIGDFTASDISGCA